MDVRSYFHPKLSDDDLARWEAVRRQGRRRYLLVHGIFYWGLPMALGQTVVNGMMGAPGPFVGRLSIAAVISSLYGMWMAGRAWSRSESQYLQRTQR